MTTLVDALVDDLPAKARTAIVARAEGVPLYAVETVRSLIDRDAVRGPRGPLRLRRPRPHAWSTSTSSPPRPACRR